MLSSLKEVSMGHYGYMEKKSPTQSGVEQDEENLLKEMFLMSQKMVKRR